MADSQNTFANEEWRDAPSNSNYEVSSFGRVRRKAYLLKPHMNAATGYRYVNLGRSYRGTVHRLVCMAFHGEPSSPEHWQVAHGDGDRTNNRADNLRWATPRENGQDAIRHGTSPLIQYRDPPTGERHGMARLSEVDVDEIKRLGSTSIERQEIARRFGISRNQLWRIMTGKAWRHRSAGSEGQ